MIPLQYWFNLSVYVYGNDRYAFLNQFLCPELLQLYDHKDICNFYFNLSSYRGAHIILFLEGVDTSALQLFDRRLRAFLASYTGKNNVVCPVPDHETLFLDIPEKSVCYNLSSMSSDPFLYFTPEQRKIYYHILRDISIYIMGLKEDLYEKILSNKLIFIYNLVLFLLKTMPVGLHHYRRIFELITDSDLEEISIKLNRDIESSLKKNYHKNSDVLHTYFENSRSNRKTTGDFLGDEPLVLLTDRMAAHFINETGLFPDIDITTIFTKSLLKDIYKMFDFDNGVTCNYFIKSVLVEQSMVS